MEPMDKWRSGESFEHVGIGFKDALLNKGRVERERKRTAKKAARKARWKKSKARTWMWRAVGFFALFVVWGIIANALGWG
jgi:hypothetical protein